MENPRGSHLVAMNMNIHQQKLGSNSEKSGFNIIQPAKIGDLTNTIWILLARKDLTNKNCIFTNKNDNLRNKRLHSSDKKGTKFEIEPIMRLEIRTNNGGLRAIQYVSTWSYLLSKVVGMTGEATTNWLRSVISTHPTNPNCTCGSFSAMPLLAPFPAAPGVLAGH